MQKIITGLLILVALNQIAPIIGVLGVKKLTVLYGLSFDEPNIAILMRHRAILFGLLGSFLLYAAFRPELQPLAFTAGFISLASFVAVAWSVGGYNDAIRKLIIIDLVAVACLVVAMVLFVLARRAS